MFEQPYKIKYDSKGEAWMKKCNSMEITCRDPVIKLTGDSHDTQTLKGIERFDQFALRCDSMGRCGKRSDQTRDYRVRHKGQKPTHNQMSKIFCGFKRVNILEVDCNVAICLFD